MGCGCEDYYKESSWRRKSQLYRMLRSDMQEKEVHKIWNSPRFHIFTLAVFSIAMGLKSFEVIAIFVASYSSLGLVTGVHVEPGPSPFTGALHLPVLLHMSAKARRLL